jgi:hypothetical protein
VNSWINLTALWQIVVVGLLAGAGLPALFAVGLRALNSPGHGAQAATASNSTTVAGSDRVYGGNQTGLVIAVLCFAIVLAAIGWGIYLIVAGT